jgi:hypothetical protein
MQVQVGLGASRFREAVSSVVRALSAVCAVLIVSAGCAGRVRYPVVVFGVQPERSLGSESAFKEALQWRWNMDRIVFYCQRNKPENRALIQQTKPNEGDWTGDLWEGQRTFSRIWFVVRVRDAKPTVFELNVRRGDYVWSLDGGSVDTLRQSRLIGYAQR